MPSHGLSFRGVNFELDHPVIGPARFEGNPMLFSRTRPDNWRSAPLLGEDNEYVFKQVIGLDGDELSRLQADGVI
jgi:crotonobetainyl-CoA:carnitine CoA-transferase CaiB-like acyl-CoA transferase